MNMSGREYCWQCGKDGHNSRSCKKGCTEIKLFGVQIAVDEDRSSTVRKSKSLGNLQSCSAAAEAAGYLSDHQSSTKSQERKRGKAWSEEEHVSFLAGLEKLGKGDWKGIANTFVPSRTSTQVASHAQKYFNRFESKRRRPSVFDVIPPPPPPHSASKAAPMPMVATSVRPPLNKRGIPDYMPTVVYQQKQTRSVSSFPTHEQATVSRPVPMLNLSGSLTSGFQPNIHGFITHHQQGSSALPTTNNDDLNLNIRKLKL